MNKKIRHGDCAARLYGIWKDMKKRCYNKRCKAYKNYGGRGIGVCEEWKHNYPAFKKWAMANGYRDDLTIDRIDNDKGYNHDNCRWATPKEQANNRRNHIYVNGYTMRELAQMSGVKEKTINDRLLRGCSMEECMQKTTKRENWKDARRGIPYKVLSKKYGIPAATLRVRFSRGWTFEEAIKK